MFGIKVLKKPKCPSLTINANPITVAFATLGNRIDYGPDLPPRTQHTLIPIWNQITQSLKKGTPSLCFCPKYRTKHVSPLPHTVEGRPAAVAVKRLFFLQVSPWNNAVSAVRTAKKSWRLVCFGYPQQEVKKGTTRRAHYSHRKAHTALGAVLRCQVLLGSSFRNTPFLALPTTAPPSVSSQPVSRRDEQRGTAAGARERAPMHPKLSRVARRILCCGRNASGDDLTDERNGSIRWVFSLRELRSATNSFNYDNKIGEGPLGSVYWGQVWDGSQIAVKKLKDARNGTEVEFASEVETLGRVRHKNLLSLRGYCADGAERVLVYDYMPNSSLFAHLHGTHSSECLLDWRRRTFIAIGAARALTYLHHHVTPPIIHGSIKTTNVLLDSDFQAHVGDFGLLRLISNEMDHDKIIGDNQRGYHAPEYIMFGKPTTGCDVYSFGIILLELTSGRKPVEKSGAQKLYGIRNWMLPLAKEGRYDEIADSKLNDKYSESELKRVVLIGLACTQREPEKRPTMLEVVSLLKGESKEMLSRLENEELFRPDSTASSLGMSTPEGSSDCILKSEQGLAEA